MEKKTQKETEKTQESRTSERSSGSGKLKMEATFARYLFSQHLDVNEIVDTLEVGGAVKKFNDKEKQSNLKGKAAEEVVYRSLKYYLDNYAFASSSSSTDSSSEDDTDKARHENDAFSQLGEFVQSQLVQKTRTLIHLLSQEGPQSFSEIQLPKMDNTSLLLKELIFDKIADGLNHNFFMWKKYQQDQKKIREKKFKVPTQKLVSLFCFYYLEDLLTKDEFGPVLKSKLEKEFDIAPVRLALEQSNFDLAADLLRQNRGVSFLVCYADNRFYYESFLPAGMNLNLLQAFEEKVPGLLQPVSTRLYCLMKCQDNQVLDNLIANFPESKAALKTNEKLFKDLMSCLNPNLTLEMYLSFLKRRPTPDADFEGIYGNIVLKQPMLARQRLMHLMKIGYTPKLEVVQKCILLRICSAMIHLVSVKQHPRLLGRKKNDDKQVCKLDMLPMEIFMVLKDFLFAHFVIWNVKPVLNS